MRTLQACSAFGSIVLAAIAAGACSDAPTGPRLEASETIRVSYCQGLEPIWAAFQDGDGPWRRVTPTPDGGNFVFQYSLRADRGGIATLTPGAGGFTALLVLYGAPAELTAAGSTKAIYCEDPDSKSILGTVVGLEANESAVVSGHLSRVVTTPSGGGAFTLTALGGGPHDLIATRQAPSDGHPLVTAVILRRDVELADGATAPAFDFASPESFPPVAAGVTLGDVGPEGASVAVRFISSSTEALISPVTSPIQDVVRSYAALSEAHLRPDDVQELWASTADGPASRRVEVYFRSPVDRSLTLPSPLARPTIDTITTTPVLRLRARFAPQPDYDQAASITYQQGTALVGVTMTAAYAALVAGSYDLIEPDLSLATGFDPAWTPRPGERIRWTASRVGGTVGLGADAQPLDGAMRRAAIDSDTLPGS